jgi:predicted nucleotidyltransferase
MVDPKIIKIVKEYLDELAAKGIEIKKAFIYGSHANGSAKPDSDIDLMLVSPLFDNETDKYMPAIWLSRVRTENRIEPIAIGEKRFIDDDVTPLIEIVRQEGVEVTA